MWWFTENNKSTPFSHIRTVLNLKMCHRNLLFLIFWWCCLVGDASAQIFGDSCDWTGSGLTHSHNHRAITPVYLRCSAGKINWVYPRGALRILLRLPNPEKNFRACIKMRSVGQKSTARVFLEGPKKLIPLVTDKEGVVRCFNSKNGQAALYVEASQDQTYKRHSAEIEYDLQEHAKSYGAYNPQEECRPCTMAELAHAFCISDLVTRGIMTGIEHNEETESVQLKVKVTKLIHTSLEENHFREVDDEIASNDVGGKSHFKHKTISINIPRHCGITHGTGEFVFMTRKKLGELTLRCAPRIEHWAMLVHKMNKDRSSECVLKS